MALAYVKEHGVVTLAIPKHAQLMHLVRNVLDMVHVHKLVVNVRKDGAVKAVLKLKK
jgi:predicted transposase YbfD/YdcC